MRCTRSVLDDYDAFEGTVNRGGACAFTFTFHSSLCASPLTSSSSLCSLPLLFYLQARNFPQSTPSSMAPKRKASEGATSSAAAGKSKKLAAAAASAAIADLQKGDGDWTLSTVKETMPTKLRNDDFLPPTDILTVRTPSSKEVLPELRTNERILFVESVHRGLGFPLHDFVQGLLYAYGVQIHDFTPNGILHIAVFMTLCECFLGVHPSWALWKAIFKVRPNNRGGRTFPVGGLQVQVRQDTRYFNLKFVDSAQGWRKKWFYANLDQEVSPTFSLDRILSRTKAWNHKMTTDEAAEAAPLITKIEGLLGSLMGMQLIATFVCMRVWPLQAHAHPMWAYEGPGDDTRMSSVELSANELAAHVWMITCTKYLDPCKVDCALKPYGLESSLEEVSIFCDYFCLFLLCFSF